MSIYFSFGGSRQVNMSTYIPVYVSTCIRVYLILFTTNLNTLSCFSRVTSSFPLVRAQAGISAMTPGSVATASTSSPTWICFIACASFTTGIGQSKPLKSRESLGVSDILNSFHASLLSGEGMGVRLDKILNAGLFCVFQHG